MFDRNSLILLIIFLIIFDAFVWQQIVFNKADNNELEVYFLDVGQGDSELVNLPGGVQVLIDVGPNNKILEELSSVLPLTDRYIDLVILSHPQYDHFAGLIEVLRRYSVGAFLYNGREGTARAFGDLKKIIEETKTPIVVLGQGDKIKYSDSRFDVLSPPKDFLSSKELNDTSLVIKLSGKNSKILFTGDIGFAVEDYLTQNFDVKADVLKVGHHGSKYSSGRRFLEAVNPKISVIEVGKNNYGHPTARVLDGLALIGSRIFRTDQDGTIKLVVNNEKIDIFRRKR